MASAKWDYSTLGRQGAFHRDGGRRGAAQKRFDTKKVAAKIEQKIAVEPTTWAEEGTLFQIEINFEPNQSVFSETQYADDYTEALKISQTYGGSLIVIEGHSDPLGILKAKQKGESKVVVSQMEQQAKNLSLERSQAVRKSFLDYCKKRNSPSTSRSSWPSASASRRRSSARRAPRRSGPPTAGWSFASNRSRLSSPSSRL